MENEIKLDLEKSISFYNNCNYDEIPEKAGTTWTLIYNITKYLQNDKNNKIAKKVNLKIENNFIILNNIKLAKINNIEEEEITKIKEGVVTKNRILLSASFNLLVEENNFQEIC